MVVLCSKPLNGMYAHIQDLGCTFSSSTSPSNAPLQRRAAVRWNRLLCPIMFFDPTLKQVAVLSNNIPTATFHYLFPRVV